MMPELCGVHSFLTALTGEPPHNLQVTVKRLQGGLEAVEVLRLTARYEDPAGRQRTFSCVVKQLSGSAAREADVYERVLEQLECEVAAKLLGVQRPAPDRAVLHLEAISALRAWPWSEYRLAASVLDGLAKFHVAARDLRHELPDWNYDAELLDTAQGVLHQLMLCKGISELSFLAAAAAPTKRIVLSLPKLRRELLNAVPFQSTIIHGDVHSGNVLVRRRGKQAPVLIDWGRTRWGSPLEDVSSWLQCLRFWEPEALKMHDTLLCSYLSARGLARRLSSDMRAAYWVAAAMNGLSGALAYHLNNAIHARNPRVRSAAIRASGDWLRIIRRADALSA